MVPALSVFTQDVDECTSSSLEGSSVGEDESWLLERVAARMQKCLGSVHGEGLFLGASHVCRERDGER